MQSNKERWQHSSAATAWADPASTNDADDHKGVRIDNHAFLVDDRIGIFRAIRNRRQDDFARQPRADADLFPNDHGLTRRNRALADIGHHFARRRVQSRSGNRANYAAHGSTDGSANHCAGDRATAAPVTVLSFAKAGTAARGAAIVHKINRDFFIGLSFLVVCDTADERRVTLLVPMFFPGLSCEFAQFVLAFGFREP